MTSVYEAGRVLPILMHHRLRIARENADLDQGALAAEIGVSRNTIVNAETARRRPHPPVLKAWAIACDVRLSWLLTGAGTPPGNGETLIQQTHSRVSSRRSRTQLDGLESVRKRRLAAVMAVSQWAA